MRRVLIVSCLLLGGAALAGAGGQGDAKKVKPQQYKLTAEEQQLLDLTNAERKKHDLPPLRFSPILSRVARAHSVNMAKQKKMDHVLDGKTPFQRLKAADYVYEYAGENVAYRPEEMPLKAVMKGWMDSPLHRQNILDKNFTEIGLGGAADKEGTTIYYTQMFGTPRKSDN